MIPCAGRQMLLILVPEMKLPLLRQEALLMVVVVGFAEATTMQKIAGTLQTATHTRGGMMNALVETVAEEAIGDLMDVDIDP